MSESQLNNVRYGYFDALRGMSMILVVYWHVSAVSLDIWGGINHFLCSFRMPLFFFVSGFFAFKPLNTWNKSKVSDIIVRKFKVQIIGSIVFTILYCVFMDRNLPCLSAVVSPQPIYWFTFVLFRFFITYIIIVIMTRVCKFRETTMWLILTSIAIICITIHTFLQEIIQIEPSAIYQTIMYVFTPSYFYYLPYFIAGLFARFQLEYFEKFVSNSGVKTLIIVSVTVFWCFIALDYLPNSKLHHTMWGFSLLYPIRFLTLILVIQFFYSIRQEFDKETKFSKAIRFVGRRTLDIYFIHFFLFPDLHFLKPYLSIGNSLILRLIVTLTFSILITAFTLLIGQVIRLSPILAEWLLGVNKKR